MAKENLFEKLNKAKPNTRIDLNDIDREYLIESSNRYIEKQSEKKRILNFYY